MCAPHNVHAEQKRSRPPHACGTRPSWWDGRPGSSGGPGGRGLTSPATKRACWVSSAMSAVHRCASLRQVGWYEGESTHRKSAVAAPSCSAPSPATMSGPQASSCDDTSTPRSQQGGWSGSGGTGAIGWLGTPSGSYKVVGTDDLAHQQPGSDEWNQPGQRVDLQATCKQLATVSSQRVPLPANP